MKARLYGRLALTVILLVAWGWIAAAQAGRVRVTFTWQQEAENATIVGSVGFVDDQDCSGGRYVYSTVSCMGGFRDDCPSLSFTVNVPTAGDYYICARAMGEGWGSNSFYVDIDGQPYPPYQFEIPQNGGLWDWIWTIVHEDHRPATPVHWTAGTHTVRFWSREPDARLDVILVTDDPAALPAPITPIATQSPTPTQPPAGAWRTEVLPDEAVGPYSSIALDEAGRPHISYQAGGRLKYARWTGSAWQIETPDTFATAGDATSLALDAAGRPHISYCGDGVLKFAHNMQGGWTLGVVDDAPGCSDSSLALDADGDIYIAYIVSDTLKFAYWAGYTWILRTIDATTVAGGPSLAVDQNGYQKHISYEVTYPGPPRYSSLKLARQNGGPWNLEVIHTTTILDTIAPHTSLALDQANRAHIACQFVYRNGSDIIYVKWTGTGWQFDTIASADSEFGYLTPPSLALDGMGRPHIGYGYSSCRSGSCTSLLRYYRWTGSAGEWETADTFAQENRYPSLALDGAGNPHMSYRAAGQLKHAWKAPVVTATPSPTSAPTRTPTATSTATRTLTATSTATRTPTATQTLPPSGPLGVYLPVMVR